MADFLGALYRSIVMKAVFCDVLSCFPGEGASSADFESRVRSTLAKSAVLAKEYAYERKKSRLTPSSATASDSQRLQLLLRGDPLQAAEMKALRAALATKGLQLVGDTPDATSISVTRVNSRG